MKFGRKLLCMLGMTMSVWALAGCGNGADEELAQAILEEAAKSGAEGTETVAEQNESTEPIAADEQNAGEEISTETEMAEDTEGAQDTETEETVENPSVFAELSNRGFYFSSGAGGWGTEMFIHEDGTFAGNYHDSDMGDIGEGYPNGVQYYCDFKGKFTEPQKVNDYTYSIKIENIKLENEPGTEEIIDGILYRYSEPYGLDLADDIYIYLPESPVAELPEGFKSWVQYDIKEGASALGFYGFYNVTPEYGFSSYEIENQETEAGSDIDAELAAIEAEAKILNDKFKTGALTQMEMNYTSAELYKLWDDELNSIWGRLKETLDEATMTALTEKQRAWIVEKENAIAEAGAGCAGGSMQPLLENDKAAELTREKVYELAELLK